MTGSLVFVFFVSRSDLAPSSNSLHGLEHNLARLSSIEHSRTLLGDKWSTIEGMVKVGIFRKTFVGRYSNKCGMIQTENEPVT